MRREIEQEHARRALALRCERANEGKSEGRRQSDGERRSRERKRAKGGRIGIRMYVSKDEKVAVYHLQVVGPATGVLEETKEGRGGFVHVGERV
jgi:hypothetical protein